MAYERPRPFGLRECPPQRTWLSLTLSTFVALSIFGVSAQWYWESSEQGVTVRRVVSRFVITPRSEGERAIRKSVPLIPHSK